MKELNCKLCGKNFIKVFKFQKFCSKECSKINHINYMKNYESTEQRKKYYASEEYKNRLKEYRSKSWYKKYQDEYHKIRRAKLDMKENNKIYLKKYRQTERAKQLRIQWNKTIKGINNKLIQSRKYRAAKNNIIEKFTLKQFLDKVKEYNNICPSCNNKFNNTYLHMLTLDHKYPISKASEDFKLTGIKRVYNIDDVQPLCRSCNSKKYLKEIHYDLIEKDKEKPNKEESKAVEVIV